MYRECRDYLIGKLKEAGIKTNPLLTMKAMKDWQDSHLAAIIPDGETLTRNGSKREFENRSDKQKRKKIFDRDVAFNVIVGEYTVEKAEDIYTKFLGNLDAGIYVDGNFVAIEPEAAEWADEQDSILKAKIAVQMRIVFKGGIYKDSGFAKVNEVGINVRKG